MVQFRFLHAADIHLDSPLEGFRTRLGDAAAAPFAAASRKAFTNLIDAAIEHQVAFLVIAGDLYDGNWRDYSTGQVFVRQAARLTREGIALFLVRGNHDAESEITRALPLPEGVYSFSTRKVETFELPEIGVLLHGRGFADRKAAENFAGGFPPAEAGRFNIGVLHTSLTGRAGHDAYAPCTVEDLLRPGYHYWALGHVHARELVHTDPPILFPGNLQARHARETGAKGATLVTVEDLRVVELKPLELDAARFATACVDLDGCGDERSLRERVLAAVAAAHAACGGRPLALRLRLEGVTGLHVRLSGDRTRLIEEMQALAYGVSEGILIERLVLETSHPLAAPQPMLPVEMMAQALADAAADAGLRAELAARLTAIREKAPQVALGLVPLMDDGSLDILVSEARSLLLGRLARGEVTAETEQ